MQNKGGWGQLWLTRTPSACWRPGIFLRGRNDGSAGFSARLPRWVAREEAVDESDLIANKQAKGQTQHSGADDEATVQPSEPIVHEREGKRDDAGDQHHSGDGADTKHQQVEYRPLRFANRAQDQQRHRRGTCQAMHDADKERAQSLVEAKAAERSLQGLRWRKALRVMLALRSMRMPVEMKLRTVFVNVSMLAGNRRMRGRKLLAHPFHRATKIQHAQEDQHQPDAKFHGQPDASGNCQSE